MKSLRSCCHALSTPCQALKKPSLRKCAGEIGIDTGKSYTNEEAFAKLGSFRFSRRLPQPE